MNTHKIITIRISIETYERVEKLCPSKKWGRNDKRDFWTNIFLQGLESPAFLKAENRRVATKLRIAETLLKKEANAPAIESIAKVVETSEDRRAEEVEQGVEARPSFKEATPSEALPNKRKPIVH